MVVNFDVVQLNGDRVSDMSVYADAISDILFDVTDEEDVITCETGFALHRVLTLNELLEIEQRLVALGLVVKA